MSQANLWGAPRIHGELLKLGIAVAQSTVARYLPRFRKPPSQTWRTFLTNHLALTAANDFFTVPTATFRVQFVFVVLSHERRGVLRDRDAIYGTDFAAMTRDMGMQEVLTAPPDPYVSLDPFRPRGIRACDLSLRTESRCNMSMTISQSRHCLLTNSSSPSAVIVTTRPV